MVSSIPIKYKYFSNRSIGIIDETQIGNTASDENWK